jgi:TonB family protein
MLMEFLYYLLACAAYIALIWGLPRVLPEETSPLLRWLHWGTSVLCLLALVVPALTRGNSTFQSLGLFCGVLLVSGLLAGIRRRLQVTGRPALATTQAVLAGLAAPVLLGLSLHSTSSDVAYTDGDYTVTVTEHVFFMDDEPGFAEVKLYRSHLWFFDEYLGHIASNRMDEKVPELKAWWQQVSAISFETSTRGEAVHQGVAVPFEVNPPYHGGDKLPQAVDTTPLPTPLAAPKTYESEADKVYTYVEEMPHLPGTVGLGPVVDAVQQRLVVSPRTEEGRLFVALTISETGDVQDVRILKGLNPAVDLTVLKAVRRLPRFEPGRQNMRPVKVSLTIPIMVLRRYSRKPYPRTPPVKPQPVDPTVPDLSDLSAS